MGYDYMRANAVAKIIAFPRSGGGRPPASNASLLQILKARAKASAGALLNRIRVPGMIVPMEIVDSVTGQTINIIVNSRFTLVRVNDRDYYFDRLSGRFDGTGSAV